MITTPKLSKYFKVRSPHAVIPSAISKVLLTVSGIVLSIITIIGVALFQYLVIEEAETSPGMAGVVISVWSNYATEQFKVANTPTAHAVSWVVAAPDNLMRIILLPKYPHFISL